MLERKKSWPMEGRGILFDRGKDWHGRPEREMGPVLRKAQQGIGLEGTHFFFFDPIAERIWVHFFLMSKMGFVLRGRPFFFLFPWRSGCGSHEALCAEVTVQEACTVCESGFS